MMTSSEKILVKNSFTIEFMIAAAIKSHLLENQFDRLMYYHRKHANSFILA